MASAIRCSTMFPHGIEDSHRLERKIVKYTIYGSGDPSPRKAVRLREVCRCFRALVDEQIARHPALHKQILSKQVSALDRVQGELTRVEARIAQLKEAPGQEFDEAVLEFSKRATVRIQRHCLDMEPRVQEQLPTLLSAIARSSNVEGPCCVNSCG